MPKQQLLEDLRYLCLGIGLIKFVLKQEKQSRESPCLLWQIIYSVVPKMYSKGKYRQFEELPFPF
jgi:hypothetical protein